VSSRWASKVLGRTGWAPKGQAFLAGDGPPERSCISAIMAAGTCPACRRVRHAFAGYLSVQLEGSVPPAHLSGGIAQQAQCCSPALHADIAPWSHDVGPDHDSSWLLLCSATPALNDTQRPGSGGIAMKDLHVRTRPFQKQVMLPTRRPATAPGAKRWAEATRLESSLPGFDVALQLAAASSLWLGHDGRDDLGDRGVSRPAAPTTTWQDCPGPPVWPL